MIKNVLLAVICPILLLAGESKNYSQMEMMQLKECSSNAIIYGESQGLSKEEILGAGGYGFPHPIYKKALLDCERQIKSYGMVWNMPYEEEVEKLKIAKRRTEEKRAREKIKEKEENLLGTF